MWVPVEASDETAGQNDVEVIVDYPAVSLEHRQGPDNDVILDELRVAVHRPGVLGRNEDLGWLHLREQRRSPRIAVIRRDLLAADARRLIGEKYPKKSVPGFRESANLCQGPPLPTRAPPPLPSAAGPWSGRLPGRCRCRCQADE